MVFQYRHIDVGTNGNKYFQIQENLTHGYGSDESTIDVDMKTLDEVDESEIDFVDGLIPTENFLDKPMLRLTLIHLVWSSNENTTLEVIDSI